MKLRKAILFEFGIKAVLSEMVKHFGDVGLMAVNVWGKDEVGYQKISFI